MLHIHLKNRYADYDFDILDKFTVIRGDSGTGKTTLFYMIESYNKDSSSVSCYGYKSLYAVNDLDDRVDYVNLFTRYTDNVFIIDENNKLFKIHDFEIIMKESDNYFIIINREKILSNLPIHLRSMRYIKDSGKYHTLQCLYTIPEDINNFTCCITEDKKAGKAFIGQYIKHIISSNGKNNIACAIKDTKAPTLLAYDVAGIGEAYSDIIRSCKYCEYPVTHLAWDSFEAYIMDSTVYKDAPREEYSCRFNSYEQYATILLARTLKVFPGISYNKDTLPACLRTERCRHCDKASCCAYVSYTNDALLCGRLKEVFNKGYTKSIEISADLMDRIWNQMPECIRSEYGTTKEEIVTNYYKDYSYLFE